MIIGFLIGKRYGWQLRDNIERSTQLKKSKKDLNTLNEQWNKLNNELKEMKLSVIHIKIKKDNPPTLEEQLKRALEEEAFETARDLILKRIQIDFPDRINQ